VTGIIFADGMTMHEMAVTQSILDIAIQHANQAGASQITQVDLIIGEMTGIVDESVQLYFDFLSRDTIAAGAALVFDRRPAVFRCRECGSTYHAEGIDWRCPECEALAFEVMSGRELQIASIQVEDALTQTENTIE
jgi:hydrogenase nickel incorporation protein HypA/HybF